MLSAAIARLPVDQREAFLLRHMEGLSYAQMVPVTGASTEALKQRVHRARERLGHLLKEVR
jgi:RNA polymerase sigma-70 factor (ECF subfamily)